MKDIGKRKVEQHDKRKVGFVIAEMLAGVSLLVLLLQVLGGGDEPCSCGGCEVLVSCTHPRDGLIIYK